MPEAKGRLLAMPEHIARALVGGLVLSLLPGQSCLCTA
jgi:hypothetical protein